MTDPRDYLNPVEVVGEDDDVTAGSVGYEGDALHRANTEGFVPNIAGPSQDLVTLHSSLETVYFLHISVCVGLCLYPPSCDSSQLTVLVLPIEAQPAPSQLQPTENQYF